MLRPYQQQALEALWENLNINAVVAMPTGSGKSHVIAELCRKIIEFDPYAHVLVLAHVKELLEQNAEKIRLHWPDAPVGMFCAGLNSKEFAPITVASVQSVARRCPRLPYFEMIIVDEAHRIPHGDEGLYHRVFRSLPDAKIVGLTATPYRLGGGMIHRGADALFHELVFEIETRQLVRDGFLAPIRPFAGSAEADLAGVHTRGGDFIPAEMAEAFDEAALTRHAVDDVLAKAADRQSLMVFCCSIAHCDHVAGAFRAAGMESVAVITGKTPAAERAEIIARFRARQLRALINCDVLTTGFDAPNIDCIVLLRATKSPGLYVQIVGRGLRLCEGKKDCLLLDYGGNVERHGPIDEVTVRRVENQETVPVRRCPDCSALVPAAASICPECGRVLIEPQPEPRKISHEWTASHADPLVKRVPKWWRVKQATCSRYEKPGKPPSMRVRYLVVPNDVTGADELFFSRYVHEWVCFEHGGYASVKAAGWSMRRGFPAPKTVTEALTIRYPKPNRILLLDTPKFPEILRYEF